MLSISSLEAVSQLNPELTSSASVANQLPYALPPTSELGYRWAWPTQNLHGFGKFKFQTLVLMLMWQTLSKEPSPPQLLLFHISSTIILCLELMMTQAVSLLLALLCLDSLSAHWPENSAYLLLLIYGPFVHQKILSAKWKGDQRNGRKYFQIVNLASN